MPSDNPSLRRPSDFGSPGVAVATAPSSRVQAMSLREQDNAMEMLLQVAVTVGICCCTHDALL